MKFANISLGKDVDIEPSSSINNVIIGDNVRVAKWCHIYGGPDNQLELGANSYVGMSTVLNGFAAKLKIGQNVSISQFVNIMVDTGPNASPSLQRVYPIKKGPVTIGNDCWIGASAIITPNVTLGDYCIVATNSFVNRSFPSFSIIGGTPARLLRSFTEEEKALILEKQIINQKEETEEDEINYVDLPFEDELRQFRIKNIIKLLNYYPNKRILTIGFGPRPLFQYIEDYERMVVVEPGKLFYKLSKKIAESNEKITLINDQIQYAVNSLKTESFDFIVIGGFLHGIDNPDDVLQAVRELCSNNTVVYSYVPNANSFHRLLAVKMGVTSSIYERSEYDKLFDRQGIYDKNSFGELFSNNHFKVQKSGTYFIKPFTHDQLHSMLYYKIIDQTCLEGLWNMTEFLPDMGAELWNISKRHD